MKDLLFSLFLKFKHLKKWLNSYWIILELVIKTAIYFGFVWLYYAWINRNGVIFWFEIFAFYIFVLISWHILTKISQLAKLPKTQRYLNLIFYLARVHFIIFMGMVLIKLLFGFSSISLIFLSALTSLLFIVNSLIRCFMHKATRYFHKSKLNKHYVIIIADGFSEQIIDKIDTQKEWGFNIAGIISSSKLIKAKFSKKFRIYPENVNLCDILDKNIIDEIIYCKSRYDEKEVKYFADICAEIGVIFRQQSSVTPIDPFEIQFISLKSSKNYSLVDKSSLSLSYLLKTIIDLYFSIVSVIILSPVFIFIGILIKADSKGPVFFIQERVGLRGRIFKLYKFRTMVSDAEIRLSDIQSQNQSDGPVFKLRNDPRVTTIGKILRKTGLDELPQLFNIIKGEMSLIGPRPPLIKEVASYKRWQLRRLSVKPGITCSWQVIPNRNDIKFDQWIEMDLNYIDSWNMTKDIRLLFRTILIILLADGR